MYQNCCKKCGSVSLHTEVKGKNTGLYCDDCGAWIKWLGKDELRAFEYANKSRGLRATAKLYDEAFVNNEVIKRLNRFIDGIDKAIDKAIDSVYANPTAEHLKNGQTCKVVGFGQSMTPILKSGQPVICKPVTEDTELKKNDIVLCKVKGNYYLHKISAIKNGISYQISNNHGHVNGTITRSNIFGIVVEIL